MDKFTVGDKYYMLGYAKGEKDGRRWERDRIIAIIERHEGLLDLEKVELVELTEDAP